MMMLSQAPAIDIAAPPSRPLWPYVLIAALAFLAGLIAFMPLSAFIGALPENVAAKASGTTRHGIITGQFLGPAAGRQRITLNSSPFDLIDLTFDGSFDISGRDIAGRGILSKGISGPIRLKDVQSSFDISQLRLPLPLTGIVDLTIREAVITSNGHCESLTGEIKTDAFARSRDLLGGWIGPALTGTLQCDAGQLTLMATGSSGSDQLAINGVLGAKQSRVDIRVNSQNQALRLYLPRFGFKEEADGVLIGRFEGGLNDQ